MFNEDRDDDSFGMEHDNDNEEDFVRNFGFTMAGSVGSAQINTAIQRMMVMVKVMECKKAGVSRDKLYKTLARTLMNKVRRGKVTMEFAETELSEFMRIYDQT